MKKALSTNDLSSNSKQVDHELKLIHKQIALAEQSYSNLIKDFTNLTVDLNRVSVRKEELCDDFSNMAIQESLVVQRSLSIISKCQQTVSTNLNDHINTIQSYVVQPISKGMSTIKLTRGTFFKCSSAKTQQYQTKNKLDNNSKSKKSKKQISTDVALQNELLAITKQVASLEKQIADFEKCKVNNMKVWLHHYIHSSLSFHVKAVEQYTKAYQAIALIDTDQHLEHFQENLFPSQQKERVEFVRWNSFNSLHT